MAEIDDLLYAMRTGEEQPAERIAAFVAGVVAGEISRAQAAAWLAWAWKRGLTDAETVALTRAMTESGDVLAWSPGAPLVDKHSTGGVGDKVSLVLAPLWAELGLRVPMISGRGLGHTGGTLDKLEAIPGFRCDLSAAELSRVLDEVGCFISGQTGELAPADRVLYGLRNETCTVDSPPLAVASILSKKLAEGAERLVLDVKVGSGSFTRSEAEASRIARLLVDVATGAGVPCIAVITAMDRPLGRTIGNALEVEESVDALKGGGPDDLREVTLALTDHPDAERVLASGAAYERFCRMVSAQGGDVDTLGRIGTLHADGTSVHVVEATRSGVVGQLDALAFGRAVFRLGAGRVHAADPVDFAVGARLKVELGDAVEAGQPLVELVHRDGHGLDAALSLLAEGIVVDDGPAEVTPLIRDRVRPRG